MLRPDDHGINRSARCRSAPCCFWMMALRHLVEIAAGGEVHDRIRPPPLGPLELFDFFIGPAGDRRCPHVGVDLGQAGAADAHGFKFEFQVILVGGNNHPAGGDFDANLFRVSGAAREERYAVGFGRDNAPDAGLFKLRFLPSLILRARREIHRGDVGDRRHSRRVGGTVGVRCANTAGIGEAAGRGDPALRHISWTSVMLPARGKVQERSISNSDRDMRSTPQ